MPQILKNITEGKVYMSIIVYGLIFIIGTLFGSFFTLAIYRIPIGENILYKHSFCPNCKEKLKFKELIPVISYIALGGKCAHCGQKIRIRYLVLELLTGVVFLLLALLFRLDVVLISSKAMVIYFIFYILYFASLFIIAGIDKENINIQRSLLVFAIILSFCYMTYVCIQNARIIYTYIIYLVCAVVLLIFDILFFKKHLDRSYTIGILELNLYMMVFSRPSLYYFTVVFTLIWIVVDMIILKIKERNKGIVASKTEKIPIGFYLCVSNIFLMLVTNFLYNWVV